MARKEKSFFTFKELKHDILRVQEKEQYVYIPNETFKDLVEAFKDLGKTSVHIATAYSALYLSNYQWRYAKYVTEDGRNITDKLYYNILGFGKPDTYNYITKKGGLLEEIGYIEKVKDKPCMYTYDEDEYLPKDVMERMGDTHYKKRWLQGKKPLKETLIFLESQMGETISKTWTVNKPIKMYDRYNDEDEADQIGTLDDIDNTHRVDVDVFIFCMTTPELGVEAFYLWSFLKHKCDMFKTYDCSLDSMVEQTGMTKNRIVDNLKELEKRNMITNDHKPYCLNRPEGKKTKANTYGVIKNVNNFISNEEDFNVIPEPRKVDKTTYEIEIGWVTEEINEEDIEVLGDGRKVNKVTGEIIVEDMDRDELPEAFGGKQKLG